MMLMTCRRGTICVRPYHAEVEQCHAVGSLSPQQLQQRAGGGHPDTGPHTSPHLGWFNILQQSLGEEFGGVFNDRTDQDEVKVDLSSGVRPYVQVIVGGE